MKLSEQAIERIKESQTRMRLALSLGFSDQHIYKGILFNKDNGFLTKAYIIKAIQKETGLSEDEILTETVDAIAGAKVIA